MKITINDIKITPKNMKFNFCVWGEPSHIILDWINHWGFKTEISGSYTNILIEDQNFDDIFLPPKDYYWVDGFSPNLNKHLHLGHLSNLVIAKSFQSIGVGKKYISILGDTLDGDVEKKDALLKFKEYCEKFNYNIDEIFFASEQDLKNTNLLSNGTGDYVGTKIFNIGDEKIVGIKSNGQTTYFYQDIALAEKLNKPTLYITGQEQDQHFGLLEKLYPNNDHIGLGLVTVDGKKMSSSEGNVIFANEIIESIKLKFNNDEKLSWNILCGYILKYDPKSTKDIGMSTIDNVKLSNGLYLSYTLAKMKSAGIIPNNTNEFNSKILNFKLLKSKINLTPNTLFEELLEHCKLISKLYITHTIKNNDSNKNMFQPLVDDLLCGMKLLGMFDITKV